MNRRIPAFTLLEILLAVVIFAISAGMVTAWTSSALSAAELQTTTESMVSIIRNLQSAAYNNYEGDSHGIRLEAAQYTTFEGTDFASSVVATRQVFIMPTTIQNAAVTLSGGGIDLIFDKSTGNTGQYGSFEIFHVPTGDKYTVSISEIGLVDYL